MEYEQGGLAMVKESEGEVMYLFSRCCNSHWELTYVDGCYGLECVECGKPVGGGVEVVGRNLGKTEDDK
jgi:hypothetical protein